MLVLVLIIAAAAVVATIVRLAYRPTPTLLLLLPLRPLLYYHHQPLLLLLRAFPRFLTEEPVEEPVGGCTGGQKAWQTWTFVDFGHGFWPNSSGQHGREHEGVVAVTGCAGVGFGAARAGGFLPVEAAGSYQSVAGA